MVALYSGDRHEKQVSLFFAPQNMPYDKLESTLICIGNLVPLLKELEKVNLQRIFEIHLYFVRQPANLLNDPLVTVFSCNKDYWTDASNIMG